MNEEHIHNIPLFANLNSREQRSISKAVKLEKYRQDEVLFKNYSSNILFRSKQIMRNKNNIAYLKNNILIIDKLTTYFINEEDEDESDG